MPLWLVSIMELWEMVQFDVFSSKMAGEPGKSCPIFVIEVSWIEEWMGLVSEIAVAARMSNLHLRIFRLLHPLEPSAVPPRLVKRQF